MVPEGGSVPFPPAVHFVTGPDAMVVAVADVEITIRILVGFVKSLGRQLA